MSFSTKALNKFLLASDLLFWEAVNGFRPVQVVLTRAYRVEFKAEANTWPV